MATAETASEAAMLPGVIETVMSVVAAGIMAHPLFAPINVGSVGMSFLFAEVAVFLSRTRGGDSRRTVLRDVLMAATDLRLGATACMAAMLCQG
jgi:hypothetical protein